jgi:serine phosphatase RsbU (regulator of sigma subunit)
LRYVNCGHNPPLLLRANGDIEALNATATVLGLFEEWDCSVAETELSHSDILVIYTDGVSEATGENEEEFGEERLVQAVRGRAELAAKQILDGVIEQVQHFSRGEQADDITLVIAKGKGISS